MQCHNKSIVHVFLINKKKTLTATTYDSICKININFFYFSIIWRESLGNMISSFIFVGNGRTGAVETILKLGH